MIPMAIWFRTVQSKYNPLINYKGNTFVDNGVMRLADSGMKPKYHAEMNSGKGVKTDTVGTEMDLSSVTDATSMIYMIDGVATYTETLFYLFNTDNVYKDLYYFSDTLTQQEISKYSLNPNGFFQDVQDGVIDNCVLNMPMDGTDEFVRDYANYSELIYQDIGGTFIDNDDEVGTHTYANGVHTIEVTTAGTNVNRPYITMNLDNTLIIDSLYEYTYDIKVISGVCNSHTMYLNKGTHDTKHESTTNGSYNGIYSAKYSHNKVAFVFNGTNTFKLEVRIIKLAKLTGIHQISDYTTSARDTTSTLNYGSQELNFLRDGLWRGRLSKFLECNGEGYADNGWVLTQNSQFTLEVILSKGRTNDLFGVGLGYNKLRITVTNKYVLFIQVNQANGGSFHANFDTNNYMLGTLVWDNGTMIAYANGLNIGTESDLTINQDSLIIGKTKEHIGIGTIHLLKVHQKAMTDQEVQYRYDQHVKAGLLN